MTWAKFDDRYDDHPKVKRAWRRDPATVGLHAMAVTYSSRHETDGYVDLDWLAEKMPNPKAREKAVKALVDCGLFDALDGERFVVHDYTDYNPSSAQLTERRRKDTERKAAAKRPVEFQTESESIPDGFQTDSERTLRAIRGES